MGLLSIFPESFAIVETWITRVFVSRNGKGRHCLVCSRLLQLFLGLVMIGPWAALLVYDLVLYVLRAGTYEIPYVGGRARGKARPRAPSLTERPTGRRRRFSLARRSEDHSRSTGTSQAEAPDTRFRHITEENDGYLSAT